LFWPGKWSKPANGSEGKHKMEYLVAGLISLALGVYLLIALLRPEKF
jgi:K+-transporting ATPase KdpF subunit